MSAPLDVAETTKKLLFSYADTVSNSIFVRTFSHKKRMGMEPGKDGWKEERMDGWM